MKFKHLAFLCLFIFGQSQNVYAENEFTFAGKAAKEVAAVVVITAGTIYLGGKFVYDCFKSKNEDHNQRDADEDATQAPYISTEVLRQAHYKNSIINAFEGEKKHINKISQQYIKFENEHDSSQITPVVYRRKRLDAIFSYKDTQVWREDTYYISREAKDLLLENNINVKHHGNYFGNQIQRELHQEFIDIIEDAGTLRYASAIENRPIAATLVHFADAGQLYNHAGKLLDAYSFADFCHGLLKVTSQLPEISCDIFCAVGRGAAKGMYNVGHKVMNPTETLHNTIRGTINLIKMLAQIEQKIEKMTLENHRIGLLKAEQMAKDLAAGRVTESDLRRQAFEDLKRGLCSTVKGVYIALERATEHLNYQKVLLGLENGTEIITEAMLTNAALGALSSFTKNASIGLSNSIKGGPLNFTDLPLDPSTVSAAIYYDAALADVMNAGVAAVEVVGVAAADVLDGASKLAPALSLMHNGPGDGGQSNLSTGKGVVPSGAPTDALEAIHKFTDIEYAQLQYNYDGKIIHKGRPVTFNYRHVFEGEPYKSGKNFGGLHQDPLGDLRRQGFSRVVKMDPSGFNEVEVLFKGRWIRTTNFPDHWDYDEIMKCVFEVFNRGKIVEADGIRTVYEDLFLNNVKIRIVVEDAAGLCITFYPRLLN